VPHGAMDVGTGWGARTMTAMGGDQSRTCRDKRDTYIGGQNVARQQPSGSVLLLPFYSRRTPCDVPNPGV